MMVGLFKTIIMYGNEPLGADKDVNNPALEEDDIEEDTDEIQSSMKLTEEEIRKAFENYSPPRWMIETIQKIGKECLVDGVLDKAESPTGPGLWFMDSSSAAAEMVTLAAAAGYVVHFFPTGQGNIIGNPIIPVIKICANPRTVRTMSEHVDVDVSGLLRKEMSPGEAGDTLLESMFRTVNGRLTSAEALGHREFVLTRLYESA